MFTSLHLKNVALQVSSFKLLFIFFKVHWYFREVLIKCQSAEFFCGMRWHAHVISAIECTCQSGSFWRLLECCFSAGRWTSTTSLRSTATPSICMASGHLMRSKRTGASRRLALSPPSVFSSSTSTTSSKFCRRFASDFRTSMWVCMIMISPEVEFLVNSLIDNNPLWINLYKPMLCYVMLRKFILLRNLFIYYIIYVLHSPFSCTGANVDDLRCN